VENFHPLLPSPFIPLQLNLNFDKDGKRFPSKKMMIKMIMIKFIDKLVNKRRRERERNTAMVKKNWLESYSFLGYFLSRSNV